MRSFILYILLILSGSTFSQSDKQPIDLNISAGAGIPEMFHTGLRVDYKNWHFDVSGGTSFDWQFSITGNAAYHFGAIINEDICSMKPWFVSLGGSYMQWESSQAFGQDVYINGRLGRDFNLTDWFKLNLSLGLGVSAYHYKYDKNPSGWNFDIWVPVIPSGQFSMQFNLSKIIRLIL